MRLRNKKTGEIIDLSKGSIKETCFGSKIQLQATDRYNKPIWIYNSLAELNEEWEDAPEEPKKYYFIDPSGEVVPFWENEETPEDTETSKSIGNYFETKEEAEKAVEKLKAWKRLKDKGFRFTLTPGVGSLDINPGKFQIEINADMPAKWFCCDAVQKDLDDCFGGEE